MKIARLAVRGRTVLGIATEGAYAIVGPEVAGMAGALAPGSGAALAGALSSGARVPAAQAQLLVPFDPGARLFCIGTNYRSHAGETGAEIPAQPAVFTRTQESIVAAGAGMMCPRVSGQYDYEGELAVVIGRGGRNIAQSDALGHVGGYTCFNDGSVRDFQQHAVTAGKNFEASGACGPWVVTADEIPDPEALTLVTRLNGVEMQRSTTDLLIHAIPRIIDYLSTITSLVPGDVIATGTPAGVGSRRTPPVWMKPGDSIEVEISRIGVLANPVI